VALPPKKPVRRAAAAPAVVPRRGDPVSRRLQEGASASLVDFFDKVQRGPK
jgi:hypothetical protein